jgi:hypothetical protein
MQNWQPTPAQAVQKARESTFNTSSHTVSEESMSTRTCKIGIHGRNHEEWHDIDFQVLRDAGVEVIKAMSQTRPYHFERMRRELPNVEIITRLHGDGFGVGHHPSPAQFAGQMIPVMADLRPYCTKFHVHNEPNHIKLYEGWGPTDDDARDFNTWFLQVYRRLKDAHPWASIGFPGLALGEHSHRDRTWLEICRPAIQEADWLGVHCYWQTPPGEWSRLRDEAFGLNFKYYHNKYPNKTIEILECGNSNGENNLPISDETIADEYVQWLQEVFNYPYINSASFFILSSQDSGNWSSFSWRTEHGAIRPMVYRVGVMFRPQWIPVNSPAPKPKPAPPVTTPAGLTNQMVINAFNRASLNLGLDGWELLNRAGLDLKALARDQATRQAPYSGPKLDQLPGLTDAQRQLIRAQLPRDVSFAAAGYSGFLKDDAGLLLLSLAAPPQLRLRTPSGALETRVARAWNRYGNLLTGIADRLGIDVALAVAVVAAEHDPRGLTPGNRLVLRFEAHLFYQRWGKDHPDRFAEHFQFDPARPWQGHRWRAAADADWREVHCSLADEWAAFDLARYLDYTAACEATALGFATILGASHAAAGYQSAAQMVDAFASSERFQVLARFDLLAGPDGGSRQADALRNDDLERYATVAAGPAEAARLAAMLRAAVQAFARLSAAG